MGEANFYYFTCLNSFIAGYRETLNQFNSFHSSDSGSNHNLKMSKAHPPELKKFMDKRLALQINGGRQLSGILRGYDPFMNLVIDEAIEKKKSGDQQSIGMVVIRQLDHHAGGAGSDLTKAFLHHFSLIASRPFHFAFSVFHSIAALEQDNTVFGTHGALIVHSRDASLFFVHRSLLY